ncbi:MAG: EamA family transporter RarD [Pseudomonadota bacterium]
MSAPGAPAAAGDQDAVRDGFIFAITAYTLWGCLPAYMKTLSSASALEVLSHRIVWSVPVGALLITLRSQWAEVRSALTTPRTVLMLAIAAMSIASNWLTYVWAVFNERILETSLAYFINPMMYVLVGVVLFSERLNRLQMIACGIALSGAAVLTVGLGAFPWVAFVLGALFTIYGYIRKTTPVGAMPGLFIETIILSPIALTMLMLIAKAGNSSFVSGDAGFRILLMIAGPATVAPLVLFALAARRLQMATLGFLQYIGPTITFFIGLYFGEPFTVYHAICFSLIWVACAMLSYDAMRTARSARRSKASPIAAAPARPAVSASPRNS